MSTIFFTSDHHFGHKNIIKFCNRPYASVEEMNEDLIIKWNDKVSPNDTVYHLGDFSFKGRDPKLYFNRLKGHKHLIIGNHDSKNVLNLPWVSKNNLHSVNFNNKHIVLCHYSLRVWNKSYHGSWMLFGHSHGKLPPNGLSFDVGVDANNFTPLSLEEVQIKMQELESQKDEH